jgi:hypothetical protein
MTSGQYSFVATYVCMSPQSEIALWPPGLVPPVFPGARKRARTADNRVFSAGLYQLSYTSVSGLIASAFGCYPVRSHACCPEILVVRASPHQASLCFGLALHPFSFRRSRKPRRLCSCRYHSTTSKIANLIPVSVLLEGLEPPASGFGSLRSIL